VAGSRERFPESSGVGAYPSGVIPLIATICFLVGGWWIFRSAQSLLRGIFSRDWPATDGEIVSVKVVKKFNSRGREVWREELEYKYSVGGTRYRATRRRFGVPARYDWNNHRTQPLRRGDRVDVIYSPTRPGVSALHRGYSPFAFLPIVAGAWIVWMGVKVLLA
jgi:hypothetical protein